MSQQEDVRRMEERRRQGDRRRDHGHGNSQSNGPDWSARERENFRRVRSQAWDRYVCAFVGRGFIEGMSIPEATEFTAELADALLAARDQRFGAE